MIEGPSLFINGQWRAGDGADMESVNPANGHHIWRGRSATAEQVDDAVGAAREAFEHWRSQTFEQRATLLRRFVSQIEHHRELLVDTFGQETGKPLWEADTEVAAMIAKADISIQAGLERSGEKHKHNGKVVSALRHRPHGVVAIFGPYNFPAHLPNGHIMPALLAGNTLVFKPSELTPRVAELCLHLWQKADLPDGVLNLVQGGRTTGQALAAHDGIDGLFFTGSASTGSYLHQQFGGHPEKILALEMGGNNPLIFADSGDLDAAVLTTIQSAYLSAGQRCTCARRLFVPRGSRGDDFVERLCQAVLAIETGPYNQQPAPFMGALIDVPALERMLKAQHRLSELGGRVLVSMSQLRPKSALLSPGLIDVSAVKDLPDEEYFGPLLQLLRYDSFDEALQLANRTRFGLSAGLFSENEHLYQRFLQRIRAGIVNWNRPLTGASSSLPFGGVGISGNHRPSAWYAADYCAYPVASLEAEALEMPPQLPPGLSLPAAGGS
ncbi:N-succinylglutamate 5-semialdehyde dehydrogenase [Marinobacterium nitratireducens]|uniref:N-succinylglutamate 5-semialdehyde dehydrogenase n=1 Tax=Marinobacterium nitratireducens TaxID=518897 RepID=A0A917Z888_9GAMM|nr:succinylglutamate-semialdehyde dehydrogenase [Marinobacterium nitratireducens]GGO77829.1 N-succinylglutamate 5-semialdehyde dehydrogenase [Marinobacterium nitratireducens]